MERQPDGASAPITESDARDVTVNVPSSASTSRVPEAARAWLTSKLEGRQWNKKELATLSGVHHSAVYEIIDGKRKLSATVAIKLAQALTEDPAKVRESQAELLTAAGYFPDRHLATPPSVITRLESNPNEPIRVAYILSEPFVGLGDGGGPIGLAVDLFKSLTSILQIKSVKSESYRLRQIKDALATNDILVSALLPTYQRSKEMEFSLPLPFLRVGLSGLVRRADAVSITVEALLGSNTKAALKGKRLLLVRNEVGYEFVQTFLAGAIDVAAATQVKRIDTLEPSRVYEALITQDDKLAIPSLLLADAATCRAVWDIDKSSGNAQLQPIKYAGETVFLSFSSSDKDAKPKEDEFPLLASFPIVFGLPKGDLKWKDAVNEALTHLMSEGLGQVLKIYSQYKDDLHPFIGTAASDFPAADLYFKRLFERLGMWPKGAD